MKLGDRVLIWGASGGLGSYATQMCLAGGATPVCVVSSPEKAEICRSMGAELVIDRNAGGLPVLEGRATPAGPEGVEAASAATIRELTGGSRRRHRLRAPRPRDLRRQRLRRPQGRHHRHLRLDVGLPARVRQPLPVDEPQAHHLGSHFANYREAWEANSLIRRGLIHPTLCRAYTLDDVGQAALEVHQNLHQGKVGVLALSRGRPRRHRPREARAARARDQPLPEPMRSR